MACRHSPCAHLIEPSVKAGRQYPFPWSRQLRILVVLTRSEHHEHLVVVLTEPVAGREAKYNDYYENLHLGEVIATTGWISAQRFKPREGATRAPASIECR